MDHHDQESLPQRDCHCPKQGNLWHHLLDQRADYLHTPKNDEEWFISNDDNDVLSEVCSINFHMY